MDFNGWAHENRVAVQAWSGASTVEQRMALSRSIGPAQVVGIGDSRHDTREQHLAKAFLARHLIEEMGFRTLVFEGSYSQMEPIDRFLTGGEGDLRGLVNRLPGWYLWDTEEMLDFLQWIRGFNEARPNGGKVRVFGMDITAPADGVRQVLHALEAAEMGAMPLLDARTLSLELQDGDFWPRTWRRYGELPVQRREQLAANYEALVGMVASRKDELVALYSLQDYERLRLLAEIGKQGNVLFSSRDRAEGGTLREKGMADVLLSIRAREAAGGKIIVWANNLHVAAGTFEMPGLAEGTLTPMGVLLKKKLSEAYLSIGGSFGEGRFGPDLPPGEREFELPSPDTMDGALARVVRGSSSSGDAHAVDERPASGFILDLRGVRRDAQAESWLKSPRRWRSQDGWALLVPAEAFDLVYFVDRITRARPTPLALRRYRSVDE